MNLNVASIAVVGLVCVPANAGTTVTVEALPLTSTAMDLSPDGRYVVGAADQNGDGFPDGTYRLDLETNTMTILPGPGLDATAVSDDGSKVLGCMPDPRDGAEVAGMWTQADGWQSLGFLPDAGTCPSRSNGYELSSDGSVAVGLSWDGCSGRGFRWTAETGMRELESMGDGGNRASVVSGDGTVIGGFAQGSFSRTPTMWNGTTLAGTLLDPPNGDDVGEVLGLSDDGEVLVGTWEGDAMRYTEAGGMEVIAQGSLIGPWNGLAMDIAENGRIIGFDAMLNSRRGWLVDNGVIVGLTNFVLDNGGTIPSGVLLSIATRISADGRKIVGHDFFGSAWLVTIDSCEGDIDSNGSVAFDDLLLILSSWGLDAPGADLAEPTDVIDFADLLVVLSNWGVCPN